MKILVMIILMVTPVFAEPFQYVVNGYGNGKKVTGFVTAYNNGTISGIVGDDYVTGHWVGLGIMEVSDENNFYELEVF